MMDWSTVKGFISIANIANKARPILKKLRMERKAALGVEESLDFMLNTVKKVIERLVVLPPDDQWWQSIKADLGAKFLDLHEFLKRTAVQEWLQAPRTQELLCKIVSAKSIQSIQDQSPFYRELKELYSQHTYEIPQHATFGIDAIIRVIQAGLKADIESSPGTEAAVAIFQQTIKSLSAQPEVEEIARQAQSEKCKNIYENLYARRLLGDNKVKDEIAELVEQLETEYRLADIKIKTDILRAAAIWHCDGKETLSKAEEYLIELLKVNPQTTDVQRVKAAIENSKGNHEIALNILNSINTPEAKAQIFNILMNAKGSLAAIEWLQTFDLSNFDLLPDWGWKTYAVALATADKWPDALEITEKYRKYNSEASVDLAFIEGLFHLGFVIAEDQRSTLLDKIILFDKQLLCDTAASHEHLGKARICFQEVEDVAKRLGAHARAYAACYWRTSILLTDRSTRAEGEELVRRHLGSIDDAQLFINLALQYNIKFDNTVLEREIRRKTIAGARGHEVLTIELALLDYLRDNHNLAKLLIESRDQLIDEVMTRRNWAGKLIRALVAINDIPRAKMILTEERAHLGEDAERYELMISDSAGENIVSLAIEKYKNNKSTIDLDNLCSLLLRENDFATLRDYAIEALHRLPNIPNALRAADCCMRLNQDKMVVELLEGYQELVDREPNLQSIKAWALFHLGRFKEAEDILKNLQKVRQNQSDIDLDINISLYSGHWERLGTIADGALKRHKEEPSAVDVLFRLAEISSLSEPNTSIKLLKEVVEKSPTDPNVLAHAGFIASQLGNDEIGLPWVHRAAGLSGDSGPIKQFPAKELVNFMKDARDRQENIHGLLRRSEIPLHLFCPAMNMPLSQIFITSVLENIKQADPRKKALIPIRHATRGLVNISEVRVILMDLTSLLLAETIDLMDNATKLFDTIYVPWETLSILFVEERKTRYHQPSRIKTAKHLHAVCKKKFRAANVDSVTPPEWLIKEIGLEDAKLLHIAHETSGYIVSSRPIYRFSSFMEEPANLQNYEERIVTPTQLIDALKRAGYLSEKECEVALEKLRHAAGDMRDEVQIVIEEVPYYINRITAELFESVGLLEELSSLKSIYIEPSAYLEWDELITHDYRVDEIHDVQERLRLRLNDGLKKGKFVCNSKPSVTHEMLGPDFGLDSLFHELSPVQAVWVDDRMLSRYPNSQDNKGYSVATLGIWDIIQELERRGIISKEDRYDIQFKLRKANLQILPIDKKEIRHFLKKADVDIANKCIKECAELRAIRENFQLLVSSKYLTLPDEAASFIKENHKIVIALIHEQWTNNKITQGEAKANWLFDNLFVPMIHCRHIFNEENANINWAELVSGELMLIENAPSVDPKLRLTFLQWLDDKFFKPLTIANTQVIDHHVEWTKSLLESLKKKFSEKENMKMVESYIATTIPSSVQHSLLNDSEFVDELGIKLNFDINFGASPKIDPIGLFSAVRLAYREKKDIAITARDEKTIKISLKTTAVEIKFQANNEAHTVENQLLLFLHPDADTRLSALEKLVSEVGATHPDPDLWQERLKKNPLTDGEMVSYIEAFKENYNEVFQNIKSSLMAIASRKKGVPSNFLVPDTSLYFYNLCGPAPDKLSKEEYLKTVVVSRFSQIINMHDGLNLVLAMGLRDDLLPSRFLMDKSDSELEVSVQSIEMIADPVSRLNLLELYLSRSSSSSFLKVKAKQLFTELASEANTVSEGEDTYSLFETLVFHVSGHLRLIPEINNQPIYWRQLCAWTHAGLLFRVLRNWKIDIKACVESLRQVPHHPMAALLELVAAPYSRDHLVNSLDIRAFIHRRLMELMGQYEDIFDTLEVPEIAASLKDPENLTNNDRLFTLGRLGPLELDECPPNSLVKGQSPFEITPEFDFFIKAFNEEFNIPTWVWLDGMCEILQVTDSVKAIVIERLRNISVDLLTKEEFNRFVPIFTSMSGIANKLSNHEIANEVLRLAREALTRIEDKRAIESLLVSALLCCAAYREKAEVIKKYSDFLIDAAYIVQDAENLKFIALLIEEMESLLPVDLWFFSRVEALCKACE